MSQRISIMMAGDHQLFRECVASALAGHKDFAVDAVGPDDLIVRAKEHQPDIVLIDMSLSNNSALELTNQLNREQSPLKVIILGLAESDPRIVKCIEAGASGYVLKEASLNDLITTIYSAYRGEAVCSPRIAYSTFSRVAELARQHRQVRLIDFANLSAREVEVLRLIADGLSNRQVADRLYLSLHTIKNHVHNILEKLGAHSRLDAIKYALANGLMNRSTTTGGRSGIHAK